jgi:hypothetical protein
MNTVLFMRVHMTHFMRTTSFTGLIVLGLLLAGVSSTPANTPPAGFTALFNGTDLSGWRGGDTFDHRKYLEMPADKRAEQDAKWTEDMKKHWSVENGEFVNDGHGKYATTEKDYGDFELLVDYKTVPKADSGICAACPRFRFGIPLRRRSSTSAGIRAVVDCGTTAPARPVKTRSCSPTSRSVNGTSSGSSWSVRA